MVNRGKIRFLLGVRQHPPASVLLFVLLILLLRAPSLALPAGFEDEELVQMTSAVDIAFVENMLLAITDKGIVYTVDLKDDDPEKREALDLTDRICHNGERGLGGLTVHPNFSQNRWIYLFYTYNRGDKDCLVDVEDGPVNRCTRWTMKDDWTVDEDSELVLFTQHGAQASLHNGGDMEFGVDGYLYITTGDGGARSDRWSQDRSNLHGNIIRITDDGGIPSDNPYTGSGTARCHENGKTESDKICQEIFAYGLRNPFRFTMDPHSTNKVRYLISDVGGKTWEEINVGGADYKGANYGWPLREGPCKYNSVTDCTVGDDGSDYTDPLYWYQHDDEEEGCAVGIAVPPSGSGWPSPYSDPSSFFFADFVYGKVYHVTENSGDYCESCNPPRPGYSDETFHRWVAPVFLKFGPYINHSSGGGGASPMALYYNFREGNQHIRRIVYKGGDNFSPTVTFSPNRMNVVVGGEIEFDASDTVDPNHDMDELIFTWDFGDGSEEKTGMVVAHEFNDMGVYQVRLTVVDPDGGTGQDAQEISVGAPPTVKILSPIEGTTFAVGDVFIIVGTGTDSDGNPLDDSTQLSWEVRQHHANHYHPFLSEGTLGNNIFLTEAPEPEDFFAASNSYLEILLTGTDSNGISTTVTRTVMPKTVELDFDTVPTGLTLSLDEEELTMPQRVLTWKNHNLRVLAPDQGAYAFSGWLDFVASGQEDVIVVPADNSGVVPKYVAVFEQGDGIVPPDPATDAPQPGPATDPPQQEMTFPTVPFDIGAVEYTDFYDTTETHSGNCGMGPVDSKFTNDQICNARGAECTVGWTKRDEWLRYDFTMAEAGMVDITIRISSFKDSKKVAIEVDDTEVAVFNAPGLGFNNYDDRTLEGMSLGAGNHQLFVRFLTSQTNFCSLSITTSGPIAPSSPISVQSVPTPPIPLPQPPTPPTPSPPSEDATRIKMYHEQGYFWQCDGVCDTSDPSVDVDPKWCLQCDGTTCQDDEFAFIRMCDTADTNFNTLFELVPTPMAGEVNIRVVNSNLCLTTENYTDKLNKLNTKMKTCTNEGSGQIWWAGGDGDFANDRFEIFPQGTTTYCLTTKHHPADGEDARVERCGLARDDASSFWLKYDPSS